MLYESAFGEVCWIDVEDCTILLGALTFGQT